MVEDTTTSTTDTEVEESGSKDPAWYRDQLEAKERKLAEERAARKAAESQLRDVRFREAGLDPDAGGVEGGFAKMVMEAFDGDLTVDAIREFASERGWEPPDVPESEEDKARREAEARADSLVPGSKPVETDRSPKDQIAAQEAEKAGTQEHIAAKLAAAKYQ